METISLVPNTILNSLYVNERKNCTGGSIVLDDRHTDYFMQVTDTTNISIDMSLLTIPNNCSVQFKLIVWSNKANVLNFSGCSIEQIEVRRGESTFTMQWTPGVNGWAVIPDVLSGYNEVPLMAWSRPYSSAKAIASERNLQSFESYTKTFDVFGQLNPYQINDSNTSNWIYGGNYHNNSTAYVWSIKPFMIRKVQLHYPANASAQYLPTSFSVYGTNDHKTWTAIISNQSTTFVAGTNETIEVTGSNNFYKSFKFDFVQDNSENSYIPPISILGYEGDLIDNRHFDWMIPSISGASGGYTATVDTSNLINVSGDAYSLLQGNGFYCKKTSGVAWTFTYELPIAKKPCGIYIKTRYNGGGQSIGTMAIFGSNDSGSTWTKISELDAGALYGSVSSGSSQDYTYIFDCNTAYDNFKIEVYSAFYNVVQDGGIEFGLSSLNFITEVSDTNMDATSIIPTLSSDSQDGYVVSATNTDDGDYYNMFDNNLSTFSAGHFDSGEWIINVQLPEATVINGIYMYSRSDNYYSQSPYIFSVQGSNNNLDWTVLESFNLGSSYWNRSSQLGVFAFPNSTAYVYYRVVCTASSSGTYCGLGELGLCANSYLPSINWTEEQYIVPVMSSDSQDGYVASAKSFYDSSMAPYKAFNRNNSDAWVAGNADSTDANKECNVWLQIQLPTADIVSNINIVARQFLTEQAPSSFTFDGSNDGTSWTTLLTVSNQAKYNSQTWDVSNSTAYLYYRILITKTNGANTHVAIGELTLKKQIIHTN